MLNVDSIIAITDFRKNPFINSESKTMAVMKNNKPEYYCVSPGYYAELLKAEKENNDLDIRLYTAYDCAVSALQVCEDENIREYLMQIIKCNEVSK